jgi:hypothetical protein
MLPSLGIRGTPKAVITRTLVINKVPENIDQRSALAQPWHGHVSPTDDTQSPINIPLYSLASRPRVHPAYLFAEYYKWRLCTVHQTKSSSFRRLWRTSLSLFMASNNAQLELATIYGSALWMKCACHSYRACLMVNLFLSFFLFWQDIGEISLLQSDFEEQHTYTTSKLVRKVPLLTSRMMITAPANIIPAMLDRRSLPRCHGDFAVCTDCVCAGEEVRLWFARIDRGKMTTYQRQMWHDSYMTRTVNIILCSRTNMNSTIWCGHNLSESRLGKQ